MDKTGAVVAYHEFDPYGNPVDNEGGDPYGFTGEWGKIVNRHPIGNRQLNLNCLRRIR